MTVRTPSVYRGNDRLLFGIILGVLAFWLFAQTPLNIAPLFRAPSNRRLTQQEMVAHRELPISAKAGR